MTWDAGSCGSARSKATSRCVFALLCRLGNLWQDRSQSSGYRRRLTALSCLKMKVAYVTIAGQLLLDKAHKFCCCPCSAQVMHPQCL